MERQSDSLLRAAAISKGNVNVSDNKSDETYELSKSAKQAQLEHAEKLKQFEIRKKKNRVEVPTKAIEVKAMLRGVGQPVTIFGEPESQRRDRLRMTLAEKELGEEELERLRILAKRDINNGGYSTSFSYLSSVGGASSSSSLSSSSSSVSSSSATATATATKDVNASIMQESTKPQVSSSESMDVEAAGDVGKEEFYTEASEELILIRTKIAKGSWSRARHRIEEERRRLDNDTLYSQFEDLLGKRHDDARQFSLNGSQFGDVRPLTCCNFSGDGEYVTTASWSGKCKIWDASSCDLVYELSGHEERCVDAKFRVDILDQSYLNSQNMNSGGEKSRTNIRDDLANSKGQRGDGITSSMEVDFASRDDDLMKQSNMENSTSKGVNSVYSSQSDVVTLATGGAECLIKLWALPSRLDELYRQNPETFSKQPGSDAGNINSNNNSTEIAYDGGDGSTLSHSANAMDIDPIQKSEYHSSMPDSVDRIGINTTNTNNNDRNTMYPYSSQSITTASSDSTATSTSTSTSTVSRNSKQGAIEVLEPRATLKGHEQRISRLAWHPFLPVLGSTSFDHTWSLWDVETEKQLLLQQGHAKATYGISFHPDGSLVAITDLSGVGRIWDLRSGKPVFDMVAHVQPLLSVDFSPNGIHVVTGGGDNQVRFWDLRKKRSLKIIPAHVRQITRVRFAPGSGAYFISASHDKLIKTWSARDFSLLGTLVGHEDKVFNADISPLEDKIVSCSYDRTWKLWLPF